MAETTLTLDAGTHALARRGLLETAATDLRRASEMFEELADDSWPVRPQRVEEVQGTLELVRESLAAVDRLGWPDTEG